MSAKFVPLAALLACATAGSYQDNKSSLLVHRDHSRALDGALPSHCQYEGRWFSEGSIVKTREACLRCQCGRGAISCRRRACAPLPEPPPPRCHTLHRKGECCPELHCQDKSITMERGASARFEDEYPGIASSNGHVFPVCVEGGTVYAAGSAMSSNTACEQCFCLGGARRCVRPQCLPPPEGCKPRPAPGVCCPQKYYCDHVSTKPPKDRHLHDCKVEGKWVKEGERVAPGNADCSTCFCLRGSVRCQSMACAPPLLGCKPLLEPGQCCPHQYQCEHQQRRGLPGFHLQPIIGNALLSIRSQDRSFRNAPDNVNETTTVLSTTVTEKTTPTLSTQKNDTITTTKVKRKTSEPPTSHSTSLTPNDNVTTITLQTTPKVIGTTDKTTIMMTNSTTEVSEDETTEQPDETVKIMINGTINCTAELSSTTITTNSTKINEPEKFVAITEIQPRIPNIIPTFETHTYNPNDIITDRNYNEDFDDNESFTINVTSSLTSSLRANTTLSSTLTSPTTTTQKSVHPPTEVIGTHNISKKTKEDYDYNYDKPTLPPSLPNLKIIPFVAADAVVDDDVSSKESLTYPTLERQDKYPVYYPSVDTKDISFTTRAEDLYNPTQFPIFLSKKEHHYPAHDLDIHNEYPSINSDIVTALQEFTVTASVGNNIPHINKASSKVSNKFELETPAVNLFSPPMETEGGFIPKDPGIIDDYYSVFSSTPSGSIIPHLTTSMQLDTEKGECVAGDGLKVPEGESINLACSVCTCAWGDLHCSQRPCHNPPGCIRRPATSGSADICCGDLFCDKDIKTTPNPLSLSTRSVQEPLNKTKHIPVNKAESNTDMNLLENITPVFNVTTTTSQPNISYNYSTILNNTIVKADEPAVKPKANTTENDVISKPLLTVEEYDVNGNNSQEYDDDEDDEGFSFGSVLKLLLSDSYETTTNLPVKKSTSIVSDVPVTVSTSTIKSLTTKTVPPKPSTTVSPSIYRPPYVPSKHQEAQNTINRIDHLVLGEATAIKMTTSRPVSVPFRPMPIRKPLPIRKPVTQKPGATPLIISKPVEVTKKSDFGQYTSVPQDNRPTTFNALSGLGSGLLKLAGCNIYGKMYRVGRIIAELSTPCQECRCTEIGVQCRPLSC